MGKDALCGPEELALLLVKFLAVKNVKNTWKRLCEESCNKKNGIWEEFCKTQAKKTTTVRKYQRTFYQLFQDSDKRKQIRKILIEEMAEFNIHRDCFSLHKQASQVGSHHKRNKNLVRGSSKKNDHYPKSPSEHSQDSDNHSDYTHEEKENIEPGDTRQGDILSIKVSPQRLGNTKRLFIEELKPSSKNPEKRQKSDSQINTTCNGSVSSGQNHSCYEQTDPQGDKIKEPESNRCSNSPSEKSPDKVNDSCYTVQGKKHTGLSKSAIILIDDSMSGDEHDSDNKHLHLEGDQTKTMNNLITHHVGYPSGFPNIKKTIYSIDVDVDSWRTLLPGKWLNDIIINVFSLLMNKAAKARGLEVLTMESYFVTSLKSPNGLSPGQYSRFIAADIWTKDIWMFPVHSENHWSLLVVVLNDKLIMYLDSKYQKIQPDLLNKLCAVMASIALPGVESGHSEKLNWTQWKFYNPEDFSLQTDGQNCGVYICMWMHVICTGSHINMTSKEANSFRTAIATIINGSDESIRVHLSHYRPNIPPMQKNGENFETIQTISKPPGQYSSTLLYTHLKRNGPEEVVCLIDPEDIDLLSKVDVSEKKETVVITHCRTDMESYLKEFPTKGIDLYGIPILPKAWMALEVNQLDDEGIINSYLLLLEQYAYFLRHVQVLPVPSFIVTSLMDSTAKLNYEGWSVAHCIWQYKIIIMPVNYANKWSLLVIIPLVATMVYINPSKQDIPAALIRGAISLLKSAGIDEKWTVYQPGDISSELAMCGGIKSNYGAHIIAWSYMFCTGIEVNFDLNNIWSAIAKVLDNGTTSEDLQSWTKHLAEILNTEPRSSLEIPRNSPEIISQPPLHCTSTVQCTAILWLLLRD